MRKKSTEEKMLDLGVSWLNMQEEKARLREHLKACPEGCYESDTGHKGCDFPHCGVYRDDRGDRINADILDCGEYCYRARELSDTAYLARIEAHKKRGAIIRQAVTQAKKAKEQL